MPKNYVEYRYGGQIIRGFEHLPANPVADGVPVHLLVPGLGSPLTGPHRMLLEISNALEKRGIASVRFDFIGSGESDGEFSQTSLTSQIQQVITIMKGLASDSRFNISRISVGGFSMGSLVAAIVAGVENSRVNRLVLLSPTFNIHEIARQFRAQIGDHTELNYSGSMFYASAIDDILSTNIHDLCNAYTSPVLVISAGQDKLFSTAKESEWVQKIYKGTAKHLSIQEADHAFQHFTWKQFVIDSTVDFLANGSPTRDL